MADKYFTLTQEYLQSVFTYIDGALFRKSNNAPAGTQNSTKYLLTRVNSKKYLVHRLIFLMHYGYLPKVVDHKDGNPLNNNINNLRATDNYGNAANSRIRKDNVTGIKGVTWHKQNKNWVVQISINGKNKHIGSFKDVELAELVAIEARDKYHGKFARHQ